MQAFNPEPVLPALSGRPDQPRLYTLSSFYSKIWIVMVL